MNVFIIIILILFLHQCVPLDKDDKNVVSFIPYNPNFKTVVPGRSLNFPNDHKPHFGFKTEWWYYTGYFYPNQFSSQINLEPTYSIQFTLFKIELKPISNSPSNQILPIVWSTHIGIANLKNSTHHPFISINRHFPGLIQMEESWDGFSIITKSQNLFSQFSIRGKNHNIYVKIKNPNNEIYEILDISVSESTPIVLQGENGFSKKDALETASYYYSIPKLVGKGKIQDSETQELVDGTFELWLDHEFSSQFLPSSKLGWDWFHFTMENGDWYMGFQVRDQNPQNNYYYARSKNSNFLNPIKFEPLQKTKVSSGRRYPTTWKIVLGKETFLLRSWIPNSEMEGFLPYWEGPIIVESIQNNEIQKGKGYLEMTGYGGRLPSWL